MLTRLASAFVLAAIASGCGPSADSAINPTGSTRWVKPGTPGLESGHCTYVGRVFLLWVADGRDGNCKASFKSEEGASGEGHVTLGDGKTLAFSYRFPDERNGKVVIDGKDFDANQGHVFLAKSEGDQLAIKQIDKDLSKMTLPSADFSSIGRSDPAIKAFFEPVAKQ